MKQPQSDCTRFTDYCNNKLMHLNTPARITPYCSYRIINGDMITEEMFNQMFPLSIRPKVASMENPDNRRKFIL